jgi:RimJ/RimL family protein N-acetyltransferase
MEKWLYEIQIQGDLVKLEILSTEHIEDLTEAVKDGALWNLWYTSIPEPQNVKNYIETAISEFQNNKSFPFVIIRKDDNKVIGTTRFMNADSKNKRLEIGTTWYSKSK